MHPHLPPPHLRRPKQANGSVSQPPNVYNGVNDKMLAILITIERFYRPAIINAILPVALVFCLGEIESLFCLQEPGYRFVFSVPFISLPPTAAMLTFFADERELLARLEVTVTLFLALTAVQFVLSESLPTSSYIVPTQQMMLATYVLLFLLSVEAIAVYTTSPSAPPSTRRPWRACAGLPCPALPCHFAGRAHEREA